MPTDYDKIREDNIREYGQGTRHLSFLGRLYTDRTHFVFELLQNAEDAGATQILFNLFDDRLEVTHDGRLFNERDVRGVCGVGEGTKAEDLTQIGKFGIGFKSVYAYTATPEVHSGGEGFRIENYVRPYAVTSKPAGNSWTTLFVFPFNTAEISPDTACKEIGARLRNLSARTLLFLRRINEIEYRLPNSKGGVYLREEITRGPVRQVSVIGQNNGKDEEENWLIFERPVPVPGNSETVRVEVSFRLEAEDKAGKNPERIVKVKDSPLVVYFPTEKATRFGFLIQGPYRTTPSRDNIPKDDDWNEMLVKETAELIGDILPEIKDLGLFSVSFLEALPIRTEDFPEDSMFYPIVESVRDTLIKKELLPADDGSFVSAENAKLAHVADLRKLLGQVQLGQLFQSTATIKWLAGEITQDKTPELKFYFMEQLGVEEVRVEKFVYLLTDQFLESQPDEWIINFYSFLDDNRTELWKKPDADLRKRKIIRLDNNSHVVPFKKDGTPNAYLPSTETTNFPTIKKSIIADEDASDFLKKLGMIEPDLFAEIIEFILPKYAEGTVIVDHATNIDDLKKIKRLFEEQFQGGSSSSLAKVKILLGKLRLQKFEDYFATAEPRKIIPLLFKAVLPSVRILKASNGLKSEYNAPRDMYKRNLLLTQYFKNNPETWFITDDYPDELLSILRELGVNDSPKVTKKSADKNGFIIISNSRGCHKRGLKEFDPDIKVEGLSIALSSPTKEKSLFIWNKIVLPNAECIRGTIEKSSRQTYENSSKEVCISDSFGRLLIESKWLPGPDGCFFRPAELRLDELPEEFERSDKLADLLGLKKDVVAKLAEEAGISSDDINFVRDNQEEFNQWKDEMSARKAIPTFPTRPVANPGRRQERLGEQLTDAPNKEYEKRERSVRTTNGAIDPITWLRHQYTNEADQMVCQICKEEMPFRKRDGAHYFEKKEVLSRKYLPKEHEAQYLALCPLCAAKYEEFVKNEDEVMAELREEIASAEDYEIPISLGDEQTSIRFVETHLHDLKVIMDEAE
jgi:hypothetical protein